jgi:16S rRNA (cytosine1402-N4)-methyltransferase
MTTKSVLAPVRAQHHPSREEDIDGREQTSGQIPNGHVSVMVTEVLEHLQIKKTDTVLDGTAGMGGHSELFLKAGAKLVISLDADPKAVAASKERLSHFKDRSVVLESNFSNCLATLQAAKVQTISKALFDLGWNSTQLQSGLGFSFMADEPLNMSYGKKPASGFTAKEIVNTWTEKVLADVFFGYGDERYARRIAKKIVETRDANPIETTKQLVAVIESAVPAAYRRGRINAATKSFQALRIAVNDELGSIEKGLTGAWNMLEHTGRIAVITFHSIEDRAVKRFFAGLAKDRDKAKLVIKKPQPPSSAEIKSNPRSRSAKLRVIEKI